MLDELGLSLACIFHTLDGMAGPLSPSEGRVAKAGTMWSSSSASCSAVPLIESPSPPALFSWGRRCRQADEGAFHADVGRSPAECNHLCDAFNRSWTSVGTSRLSRMRPPHPPSAPSPPAKNRGGRRTLDERKWYEVQGRLSAERNGKGLKETVRDAG